MNRACKLYPTVDDNNGGQVASPLYKSILNLTGKDRATTNRLYATAHFLLENGAINKNDLDDYGEPTLHSLLKTDFFKEAIKDDKVISQIEKDYFYNNEPKEATVQNVREAVRAATDFNKNSPYKDNFLAIVKESKSESDDNSTISIRVVKRTVENVQKAVNMMSDQELYDRLFQLAESMGIGVTGLKETEEAMGFNGYADFTRASKLAHGVVDVIRLAKGMRGLKAIPEEFSHVILAAMNDTPLYSRLYNILDNADFYKEVLGEKLEHYEGLYANNRVKLVKEAMGQLVSLHLFNNNRVEKDARYVNIYNRFIEAYKKKFSTFDESEVVDAVNSIRRQFDDYARGILNAEFTGDINLTNLVGEDNLASAEAVEEEVDKLSEILDKAKEIEAKRLKLYQDRQKSKNNDFKDKQLSIIMELHKAQQDKEELQGIVKYLKGSIDTLKAVKNRLAKLDSDSTTTLNQKAATLRDINDYIHSYQKMQQFVVDNISDFAEDSEERKQIVEQLKDFRYIIDEVESAYKKEAFSNFVAFLKPWITPNILKFLADKYNDPNLTVETIAQKAYQDISTSSRLLDSMAESSDIIHKIYDQAVKLANTKAQQSTIEDRNAIVLAGMKLEKAGVTDFKWMFETDSNGRMTGNYIGEYNWVKYYEDKRAVRLEYEDKYHKKLKDFSLLEFAEYKNALTEFYKSAFKNYDDFESKKELVNKYRNPEYDKIHSLASTPQDKARGEFYDTIMGIKERLDGRIPESATRLRNAVKIRKEWLEKMKDPKTGRFKDTWDSVKENFILTSSDTEIFDGGVLLNFSDEPVQNLQICYTKLRKGETMEDMSTDVVGTMIAYAGMANQYGEMSEIIHTLEVGVDVSRRREIPRYSALNSVKRTVKESFKVEGIQVENEAMRAGDDTNFMQRLNAFMRMQVYHHYQDKGSEVFGVSTAKVANAINSLASHYCIAVNVLGGISNVATGRVMERIEGAAHQFFSNSDLHEGTKLYFQNLLGCLDDIGKRTKSSKLGLMIEMFDVTQEYDKKGLEVSFSYKTRLEQLGLGDALFSLQNAGEHYLQSRTFLALANTVRFKKKGSNTKDTVSLWDAFETVDMDPSVPEAGKKLALKEGLVMLDKDGKEVEWSVKTLNDIKNKVGELNRLMHGIYNKQDANAIQELALGRMALLFRKWIKPAMVRRFDAKTFNYDLDTFTEGYYRTGFRFLAALFKDARHLQFHWKTRYNEMDEMERQNICRCFAEIGMLLAVDKSIALLEYLCSNPDDDDNKRSYIINLVDYELRRLYNEIGALTPNTSMLDEALKILNSPIAGANAIQRIMDVFELSFNWNNFEFWNGEDAIIKSGYWKGYSKGEKTIYEGIPMLKTFVRDMAPELSLGYYKQ